MPGSKEQEILEQQKKLAKMMGKKPSISQAKLKSSVSDSNPPPPTTKFRAGGLTLTKKLPKLPASRASQTRPAPKRARPPESRVKPPPPPAESTQKRPIRPTLKRPTLLKNSKAVAASAATVLAAARAKAAGHPTDEEEAAEAEKLEATESKSMQAKSKTMILSKVTRKSAKPGEASSGRAGGGIGNLASLVHHVAGGANRNDDISSASFATNIEPNDFWKSIRDWDFVSDLDEQQNQQHQGNKASNENSSNTPKKKPIPDTFISHRHYVAAWAPLCMAEARAQLLSDVLTDISFSSGRQNNSSLLVLVTVETTWKSGSNKKDHMVNVHDGLLASNDACNVQLRVKNRGEGGRLQFYTHDVCCLIPVKYKDVVEKLLRGGSIQNDNSDDDMFAFRKMAMIGHTEVSRKELNGLILKVSKRRWAQIGDTEMCLLRIGGNITSLREFTALCNIERLPLIKSLLGLHLLQDKDATHQEHDGRSADGKKTDLLQKMGGVQALGKGFTAYAQKKFNPSQLTAISASAEGYGDGGFTLIKGPPGTGKTTTLVAILNSLHIRQYNKYYEEVRRIVAMQTGNRQVALGIARKAKPRLLVCAPSNAAIDNIILKIMEDGFIDGSGQRYNPSMIRVGVGKSSTVKDVALETKVDAILSDHLDVGQLESSITGLRMELQRITGDITKCRRRVHAIAQSSQWPLGKDWEIRIDETTFDETSRVYFVNHKDHSTTYECPPPPEPGQKQFPPKAMPEYKTYTARIVKLVESYFSVKSNLEISTIIKGSLDNGAHRFAVRQALESHVLNSVHMVMTTLGTAGNRILEGADKFEVVVVDEAAQSVEPATLAALQLGSRHAVLVGDPQQLPATIFNVSGRGSKYDRSLFQRLEEAGQDVFMLNEQYRMHPQISHFPRHIFYGGTLMDGPNVIQPTYGNPLVQMVTSQVRTFHPFTVLDLDSREERGGTSLANSFEAHLAVHLFSSLREITQGLSTKSRVAVITPYSQQANLLKRFFSDFLGNQYEKLVEVNTVDAFQGREANIVIFSAVRAAGSHGIGFLSDVRRMNVALTRAKHFLFVIARCQSIVVNPYWNDLVEHARETNAVVRVPILNQHPNNGIPQFGNLMHWESEQPIPKPRPVDPRKRKAQPGPFG